MNQNPNQKKEVAEETRQRRTLYLVNIIILSSLAIVSLLFAIFVYLSTRIQGTGGQRRLYTENQLRMIREEAAKEAKRDLLLQIQSSMESGKSTTQMLREIYDDAIVVKNGNSYSFYPIIDGVEKNPLVPGKLSQAGGEIRYTDDKAGVELHRGVLLSNSNGRIDWDRLADSGIEEAVLTVGVVSENGFIPDVQFERNCRKAAEKNIPVCLCVEISRPVEEDVLLEAVEAVGSCEEEFDLQPGVLLRLRTDDKLSGGSGDRDAWTGTVRSLVGLLEDEKMEPVIGAGLYTYAAQIDLASLSEYERWLIDYEEAVFFPYRFHYWEYSSEDGMDGVPGNCIRYVRVQTNGSLEIQ